MRKRILIVVPALFAAVSLTGFGSGSAMAYNRTASYNVHAASAQDGNNCYQIANQSGSGRMHIVAGIHHVYGKIWFTGHTDAIKQDQTAEGRQYVRTHCRQRVRLHLRVYKNGQRVVNRHWSAKSKDNGVVKIKKSFSKGYSDLRDGDKIRYVLTGDAKEPGSTIARFDIRDSLHAIGQVTVVQIR
jgi:hypothetical protein